MWIFTLPIVWLSACSPALYTPIQTDADHSGTTLDSLLLGRDLYARHCGSCHNLRVPERYPKKTWIEKMPKMQIKAKISDKEARLITNFLLARCKPE
jgi:hypothetical protein